MRDDAVGFFWDDTPPPKPPKKEAERRTPPEKVWLRPDYLPGLEEALRFPVQQMTMEELAQAAALKHELVPDVECYVNYFLVNFRNMTTGKVVYVEMYEGKKLDIQMLVWLMTNFTLITFNGINYDIPIINMACAGATCAELKAATDKIIVEEQRGSDVQRAAKAKSLKIDHIDLIEVAPLYASLKTYSGRLHAKKMQDLPFHPSTVLSRDQMAIVRWYCVNDTENTALLRQCLNEHIELRYELSNQYKVDLRSKSDAQIAEAVIAAELTKKLGTRPKPPKIEVGTVYNYQVPYFIKFKTPLLNHVLDTIRRAKFVVDHTGSIALPPEIDALKIEINGSTYKMGVGGLHSSEKKTSHHTNDHFIMVDKDVSSFYPYILLNQGIYPSHLGPAYLQVYRTLVELRIWHKDQIKVAKMAGDKLKEAMHQTIADSLKIVINGAFGKLGSKYSIIYAPDLLIQTTITGQLLLLMLIERIELIGIHVVSANTDGVVTKVPRAGQAAFNEVVRQWEADTNFVTEETIYRSLYSKDVNNYIAIKEDGTTKNKGLYANPWANAKNLGDWLHKNPTNTICIEAVEALLTKGTPPRQTITTCQDPRKFICVRSVKGGAVKVWDEGHTEFIGKTVRWYYAKDVPGEMVYASSGNKVPRSDGAMPLMTMPETVPNDVDIDWYEGECAKILEAVGAMQ